MVRTYERRGGAPRATPPAAVDTRRRRRALRRRVRELEATLGTTTPALALSAYTRAEDGAKALAVGFQVHLAKPVVPEDLVTLLARLTGAEQAS